jgi:hypothetical protein
MVMFDQDQVIHPKESQLFGTLSPKNADGNHQVINFKDSDMYKQDWLGLKHLD